MKTIIRITLILLLTQTLFAQTPKHEVRAVWLTTIGGIDWPHSYSPTQQRQEMIAILDQLQRANINTVLFQARVRATTVFPSTMEPWDVCVTGTPGSSPGYDPLLFCIDECHKRGMECHAWIVTLPVGKWNTDGCRRMRSRFPGLIRRIGEEGYMNPEMPQTGDYLAQFCREITRRYDVDGIHLDYIRYPETWKLKVSRQQGRQYITDIVRKISTQVKAEKPWVKVSCSPIGKFDDLSRYQSAGWNAYTTVCQDAQGWLRDGLMDALFPMMYFQGNHFFPFTVDWKEHSYGRIVAPGLAIYMLHPREKDWSLDIVQREMGVLREQGLGCTFFRSKFFTDNTKGIYSFTRHFNRYPSLIPPMTWARRQAPSPVKVLQVKRGMTTDQLSWYGATDHSGADYLLYNIYASDTYPVDTRDARNLLIARQRARSLQVPHQGRTLYYAVTAVDRYGNESAPLDHGKDIDKARQPLDIRQLIVGKSPGMNKYKRK